MKITSKHVSNSPVTFVIHKRFAVLAFLLSCCVNLQLLAHRFSSKRETARSVGRWEKTLYLSVGIPSGNLCRGQSQSPARFWMTDCPWFVFGRPVIPSGNYRQKCWSGGINKVYYGECANGKCKKRNHMNVPWEKYRSESIVNLINNPLVFFSVNFLNPTPLPRTEDQALAEGWRNDASCGITRHCILSRFYKNCLASILHPDILFEAELKKKIPSPVQVPDDRPFMTKAVICARFSQSRVTCIYFFPPLH